MGNIYTAGGIVDRLRYDDVGRYMYEPLDNSIFNTKSKGV
jgi:hypothetical protein